MQPTILVVEDEVPLANIVAVNLEAEGYQVKLAFDGEEALTKVEETSPHIIILDLLLPKLDGWEVLTRLYSNPAYRKIPVILLTALAQEIDLQRGWDLGATAYITKPFDPMQVVKVVRRVLQSSGKERRR